MRISLLISTYNWVSALDLCLKSVLEQKLMPDEVLIADDGSRADTKALIDAYRAKFPVPLIHVWQEDQGFQLAKIRNKAIAKASGDYIVQIDGDLVLHPYFIADHQAFAEPGSFVRASRIYLDESLSKKMLAEGITQVNPFQDGVSNKVSAFRIPVLWPFFASTYKNTGDEVWEIHGCNMAYWRADAIAVNGYNEAFTGWGPEDKEFVARMLNKGFKKRFIKYGALVFHIWHPVNTKENLKNNQCLFEKAKREQSTYCAVGIDQYL